MDGEHHFDAPAHGGEDLVEAAFLVASGVDSRHTGAVMGTLELIICCFFRIPWLNRLNRPVSKKVINSSLDLLDGIDAIFFVPELFLVAWISMVGDEFGESDQSSFQQSLSWRT